MREGDQRKKKGERKQWNKIAHSTDPGRAKARWSKTAGEYSMGFKVERSSEQIGGPLEKHSNNCNISPN